MTVNKRFVALPALGAIALLVLVTSGCSNASAAPAATSTAAEPTAESSAAPEAAATDEESCAGFGDVMTILHNVGAAVHEQRMSEREREGWYGLATRVLDRVPASGEGVISDALAAMKKAAPPVGIDGGATSTIESEAWNAAGEDLREACEAAGHEVVAEGFIGG